MLRGMKRFFKKVTRTGKTSFRPSELGTSERQEGTLDALVLEFDIPAWGFRKGERVRVFSDVPIYLGDIVALRSDEGLKLARYRDEYMGSVAGLAVRV